MKKAILVALATFALIVSSAIGASARPHQLLTGPVLTIDVSGTNLVVAQDVANIWSKGTDVTVVVGTCAPGPWCEKVEVVDWPGGTGACGITCPDGYNYGSASTGCTTQVSTSAANYPYSTDWQFNVLGHETGHCWDLPHNPDSRSIMYASVSKYDSRKRPTQDDKTLLNSLW